MPPIIQFVAVKKHYKVAIRHPGRAAWIKDFFSYKFSLVQAVDNVSFEINQGEFVGYLGPNGAGKSTTIKMLTGLLVPTSGQIRVLGFTPWKDRQRYVSLIGAVFGQRTALWWDLPVIESFDLYRYLYKIPSSRYQSNLGEFRKMLELDSFIETPVRSLSLGQRMRVDLCAALLHEPKIIFLDEPTIGLDVVAKDRIRQFLLHINRERGTTILLTTHDLYDVEKLCERVMIIDSGHLLYDGSLFQLHERFGGQRQLVVDLGEDYPDVSIERATIASRDGKRVTYKFDRTETTASQLIGDLSKKFRILDLEVKEPDIEDTVRRIYVEKLLEP